MATSYARTLGKIKGFDPRTDLLSTMSLASAQAEGTILNEDSSQSTDDLVVCNGTAEAGYLLLDDVTTDGPTFTERQFGIDVGEKKVGQKVGVAILRPGMEFETKVIATSGTGAISSGTALETLLSAISGKIVVKQASGNGSVAYFQLKENLLATTGYIRVLVTKVV